MSKADADKEAVLSTLNQLSETMDVMRQVIDQLRNNVEQHEAGEDQRGKRSRSAAGSSGSPRSARRHLLH